MCALVAPPCFSLPLILAPSCLHQKSNSGKTLQLTRKCCLNDSQMPSIFIINFHRLEAEFVNGQVCLDNADRNGSRVGHSYKPLHIEETTTCKQKPLINSLVSKQCETMVSQWASLSLRKSFLCFSNFGPRSGPRCLTWSPTGTQKC